MFDQPRRSCAWGTRTLIAFALAWVSSSCASVIAPEYEYDEEIYLELDGSAVVYVNASVPALVALRGADLAVDPSARLDRNDVRAFYTSPVSEVVTVTTSRRNNRRYVHVEMNVADIRRLHEAAPFAWARYAFGPRDDLTVYQQSLRDAANERVGDVGWVGDERVAFRLHLPSRVPFHNAPSGEIERGNIIRWEQTLAERLEGTPMAIEVHMERESILFHTLTLFAGTIALALLTLASAVWWVMRRKGADLTASARPPVL